MRLPIGIQDFVRIREEDCVYVDKTMHMMPFLSGGAFFLSRPRRFGKSLLLSTLRAIFQGRKDLFAGLWLEQHHDFAPRPIIRLDMSALDYQARSLEESLLEDLRRIAREYQVEVRQNTAKSVFEELIRALAQTAKVVVLIDEYDKPITDYLSHAEKRASHQETLKSLYGVLKPLDAYLHLVLLTGVSKIGKLSLFSDLNNLQDISLNTKYATLCGYTKPEIEQSFPSYISAFAQAMGMTHDVFIEQITFWYNGYSWDGINRLYCPFSFLLLLEQQQFRSFWYESGTPTILIKAIQQRQIDPMLFEHCFLDSQSISVTDVSQLDPISLMFQTGYLTIASTRNTPLGVRYDLTYPNQEVRLAFTTNLLLEYSGNLPSQISSFAVQLSEALSNLEWATFFGICNRVIATVPYEIFPKQESYIHSLMHLLLTSTGFKTHSQVQTSKGRMDTLVITSSQSIIFEFKTKGTAKAALRQIDTARYADSLLGKVVKVGVVFDLEKKCISGWAVG